MNAFLSLIRSFASSFDEGVHENVYEMRENLQKSVSPILLIELIGKGFVFVSFLEVISRATTHDLFSTDSFEVKARNELMCVLLSFCFPVSTGT